MIVHIYAQVDVSDFILTVCSIKYSCCSGWNSLGIKLRPALRSVSSEATGISKSLLGFSDLLKVSTMNIGSGMINWEGVSF